MSTGILEGLIKPTIDTDIDMSEKTNNTYNIGTYIDKPVINIEKLVISDREMIEQVMNVLQQQSDAVQENTDETK